MTGPTVVNGTIDTLGLLPRFWSLDRIWVNVTVWPVVRSRPVSSFAIGAVDVVRRYGTIRAAIRRGWVMGLDLQRLPTQPVSCALGSAHWPIVS